MKNALTKIALNTQWQECPQLQLFSWKFFEHFAPKRHVKVAITQCASTHKRVIQKMVLAPIVSQMESQQRKAHQNFIHGLVLALSSCPLSSLRLLSILGLIWGRYLVALITIRDVSTGVTGATAVAPKFSDTLSLSFLSLYVKSQCHILG